MGGKSPKAPDPIATANAQTDSNVKSAVANAWLNNVNTYTPYGNSTFTQTGEQNGIPTFRQDITLSPEQQQLLDLQQQQDIGLAGASNNLIDRFSSQGAFNTDALPGLMSRARSAPLQMRINTPDWATGLKQAQDANYKQATSYLDPRFDREQGALTAQLANQGITQGSEAWKNAFDEFNRNKTFAYNQAQDSAVQSGNALQNQLFGQALSSGEFANTAAGQYFNQNMQNANLSNQARNQGFNEQAYIRNEPINQLSALRGLTQIQNPQVSGPANSAINPTDITSTINNNYAQRVGQYNNRMSGLFGLGGSALSAGAMAAPFLAMSDVRTKKDMKHVGKTSSGVNAYEFSYKDDPNNTRHIGAIAQEVEELIPEAVVTGRDGYKRVNYALVK